MEKQVIARVEGKVQGVWFRVYTQRKARQLGVTGYVRNLHDGSVEFLAQGTSQAVEGLLSWAHEGPDKARVSTVSYHEFVGSERYPDFTITE